MYVYLSGAKTEAFCVRKVSFGGAQQIRFLLSTERKRSRKVLSYFGPS
jgi:hypothetical protein